MHTWSSEGENFIWKILIQAMGLLKREILRWPHGGSKNTRDSPLNAEAAIFYLLQRYQADKWKETIQVPGMWAIHKHWRFSSKYSESKEGGTMLPGIYP